MASIRILVAILIAFTAVSFATEIQEYQFAGWTNTFSKSTANHVVLDVGDPLLTPDRSAKRCANNCAVLSWCGAFYVDTSCHLVHNQEVTETEVIHGAGDGQIYYVKEPSGNQITVLTDPVLA